MPSIIPENPSRQANKLFKILNILAVLQLIYGIFGLFVDIRSGFRILFGSIILFLIPCGRNWCTCAIYIIMSLMDLFPSLLFLGEYFNWFGIIPSEYTVFFAIFMLKFPFYTVTCYYCFLTYRELKAISLEIQYGAYPAEWEQGPERRQYFTGPGYVLK